MVRYLIRRVIFGAALVVVLSSGGLLLARLAPGDYAIEQLGAGAHQESLQRLRSEQGLDRSFLDQYAEWLRRALHFDFGVSLRYGRPVRDLVPERAENTAVIAVTALMLAALIGLPLGVICGSRRNAVTRIVQTISLWIVSMPPLLTTLFLAFAASRTGWASVEGMWPTGASLSEVARHLLVPVLALALPIAAMFERLQAQAMIEAIAQPYVAAARARGVSWRRMVWRDAFKVAIRPIVAVSGVLLAALLSGSFVVEAVTAWPGLGLLMLDALRAHDPYLVAACAGSGALFLAVATLAADVALAVIDPRVLG